MDRRERLSEREMNRDLSTGDRPNIDLEVDYRLRRACGSQEVVSQTPGRGDVMPVTDGSRQSLVASTSRIASKLLTILIAVRL
jgi:hypothetical protein